jgi:hypothetical protein
MKTYKLSNFYNRIIRTNEDGSITSFPINEQNTDYQVYLKWVAEGNTPEPADTSA